LGKKIPDLGEEQLDLCYSEFRKHCMSMHGLEGWDADAQVPWTLTLVK
jgi:hypothetical protein